MSGVELTRLNMKKHARHRGRELIYCAILHFKGIGMDEQEVSTKGKVIGFLHDVRAEFGKISWPNRKELIASTWLVAVVILLMSAIIFFYDQILFGLLSLVIIK